MVNVIDCAKWLSAKTYAINEFVTRSGIIYKSKSGSNLNNDPALDLTFTYWGIYTGDGYVRTTGEDTIIDPTTGDIIINAGAELQNKNNDKIADEDGNLFIPTSAALKTASGTPIIGDSGRMILPRGANEFTSSQSMSILSKAATVCTASANIYLDLPGTGIKSGDIHTIINRSDTYTVAIYAVDHGSIVVTIPSMSAVMVYSNADNPANASSWFVLRNWMIEPVQADYYVTATQSLFNGNAIVMDYVAQELDTHSAVSGNGTGNWRFTAPQSGYYSITADMQGDFGWSGLALGTPAVLLSVVSNPTTALYSGSSYNVTGGTDHYIDGMDGIDGGSHTLYMTVQGTTTFFMTKNDTLLVSLFITGSNNRPTLGDDVRRHVRIKRVK